MKRLTDFLRRNWPLRLGAILLATVLYTGLVLGQNVRTWTGSIPVDALRPPANATVISEIPPVTQVRYRAPLDVGVLSPNSFNASIDLSRVDAAAGGPPVRGLGVTADGVVLATAGRDVLAIVEYGGQVLAAGLHGPAGMAVLQDGTVVIADCDRIVVLSR